MSQRKSPQELSIELKKHFPHYDECPVCDSDEIEGYSISVEGPECHQQVQCLNCESEWLDLYVLFEKKLISKEGVKYVHDNL